jgi:hypothetical protein
VDDEIDRLAASIRAADAQAREREALERAQAEQAAHAASIEARLKVELSQQFGRWARLNGIPHDSNRHVSGEQLPGPPLGLLAALLGHREKGPTSLFRTIPVYTVMTVGFSDTWKGESFSTTQVPVTVDDNGEVDGPINRVSIELVKLAIARIVAKHDCPWAEP